MLFDKWTGVDSWVTVWKRNGLSTQPWGAPLFSMMGGDVRGAKLDTQFVKKSFIQVQMERRRPGWSCLLTKRSRMIVLTIAPLMVQVAQCGVGCHGNNIFTDKVCHHHLTGEGTITITTGCQIKTNYSHCMWSFSTNTKVKVLFNKKHVRTFTLWIPVCSLLCLTAVKTALFYSIFFSSFLVHFSPVGLHLNKKKILGSVLVRHF